MADESLTQNKIKLCKTVGLDLHNYFRDYFLRSSTNRKGYEGVAIITPNDGITDFNSSWYLGFKITFII